MSNSATTQAAPATGPIAPRQVPLLQNGDHLSSVEFERRYAAMPDVKAELVEGVVFMASPVRGKQHGKPHGHIVRWLGNYSVETPGAEFYDDSTVRLDRENVVQPDALLMIEASALGQAHFDERGYIQNGPELVAEASASTASYDLHEKMRAYRRNGVLEYLVWRVDDNEVDWFILREGQYVRLEPVDGMYRSTVFPGLWLNAKALLEGDYKQFDATFREGLASPEHRAFVERLAAHKNAPPSDAK